VLSVDDQNRARDRLELIGQVRAKAESFEGLCIVIVGEDFERRRRHETSLGLLAARS
jgi:hypothetical protein